MTETEEEEVPVVAGHHLIHFECVMCGPVEHQSAISVLDDWLFCWKCFLEIVLVGMEAPDGGCPCYPSRCPGDGTLLRNRDESREHIRTYHRR